MPKLEYKVLNLVYTRILPILTVYLGTYFTSTLFKLKFSNKQANSSEHFR